MWILLNEVGDSAAVNADRVEISKAFFALVFADKISAMACKEMVPREEQAAVNESQAQDSLR